MSITRVTYSPQKSSPTFAGKIKKTQSGNTYERTNKGKLISTSIGAGLSLASFACCAALTRSFKTALAFSILPAVEAIGLSFLVGAVIDGINNKSSKNKADIIAEIKSNSNQPASTSLNRQA